MCKDTKTRNFNFFAKLDMFICSFDCLAVLKEHDLVA